MKKSLRNVGLRNIIDQHDGELDYIIYLSLSCDIFVWEEESGLVVNVSTSEENFRIVFQV